CLGHKKVYGLNCYECTPSDGDLCADNNANKTAVEVMDCNQSIFTQGNTRNEDFICISMKEQNHTHTRYARRCGLKSEENICNAKELDQGYNLTKCRTCRTDLCNASENIHTNLFLTVYVIVNLLLSSIKIN
ncbi:hypothetical protein NQ315_013597, partial [Exocentrus adspersus]